VKIQRLRDDRLYALPDAHRPIGGLDAKEQAAVALAGPFPDRWAAQDWVVAQYATQIPDGERRQLYEEAWLACGGADADPYHLYTIVGLILHGRDRAVVLKHCASWGSRLAREERGG